MTVDELIKRLELVTDKTRPVQCFESDFIVPEGYHYVREVSIGDNIVARIKKPVTIYFGY